VTTVRAVLAAIVLGYAVLGLVVLTPDAIYSGDIGVKYVQARALVANRFASLDIPYPGAFIDPERTFFPMRPPFVMEAGGTTQAIFSPVSSILQALGVALADIRGLVLLTILSAAAILYSAARLVPDACSTAVVAALGIASPLWFYAVSGWEHAPAVACGTAAFAVAVRRRGRTAMLLAGALVGAGATIRDEVLLLLPGLLLVAWLRDRRIRDAVAAASGALVPLLAAAVVEVWWFERPVAAHLRHAVHLLQSAVQATDVPSEELPSLTPFTLRDRYDTVVVYWLLGYGRPPVMLALAAAYGAGWLARIRWKTSAGFVPWLVGILVLASVDLVDLLTAPKWLAGLFRVAPYTVMALIPAPVSAAPRGRLPGITIATTAAYLALAFAGVDTTGGKSLGPRLLLPLLPLLAAVAVWTTALYWQTQRKGDRVVAVAGMLLVVMCALVHLTGTMPAYVERNAADGRAVRAVADSPARVVVADDQFTAQLLFPLYYRKVIFLADSVESGRRLGELLDRQHVARALIVSQHAQPSTVLPPLHLDATERHGRTVIQQWQR
jgi:hypothetical protein